jgi:hypothetical protein
VNQGYRIEMLCEVFGPSCEQFESLAWQLQGETTATMEHGQVEALIFREGMELLRRMFQAHLDVRSEREVQRESVPGADGILRTLCRYGSERSLMSRFGEVSVRRRGYSAPGADSLFPLDGQLNLPCDKYSDGLRYLAAGEVAAQSFDEAMESIREKTAGKIPKRQLEQVSARVSVDFDAFYSQATDPEGVSDLLVVTTDGKGIVMCQEDLRPATRKAAQEQKDEPCARLQPGQKSNRKRMATVAAVYSIETEQRTAEQIMGHPTEPPARPRATNKRVWASVEKDPDEVIRAAIEEALCRDPTQNRHWVILVDGQEHQLELILSLTEPYTAQMTLVLDFIHVLEYLWKAAYCFHLLGSKEAEQWVSERALEILRGNAAAVAAEMCISATSLKLSANKRKAVDKCANYLEKYLPILQYDRFLSQGLPIATGVIEGACRHLIKDRMDITGARWRLKSAEAVLRIRSLRSSGDLKDYWRFHCKQEHHRNHACRYAEPLAA